MINVIDSPHERIRSLHAPCRPRTCRPSLRDSEARRGSPQGCGEESEPARAETKTTTARLPRGSRPYLEGLIRFSHLAGDLGKSKALSDDVRHGQIEAVCVSHGIVFGSAV